MDYFIIPNSLAERLGVKETRLGNNYVGYLVNSGDFAGMDSQEAVRLGARKVNIKEAKKFIDKL